MSYAQQPASKPIIGGASAKAASGFQTGLEDFNIPWDFGGSQSGSIGSQPSSDPGSQMQASAMSAPPEDSGGSSFDVQGMMDQLETQKIQDDYKRMVAQARFFLPRTLQDLANQYGSQGSYWSSGRRGEQMEAAKKTRFDLTQAKADAEFQLQMKFLEQAAQNQAEQGGRSA